MIEPIISIPNKLRTVACSVSHGKEMEGGKGQHHNCIIIIIITAICIVQNRLRATNALSGSSSTVTT